MSLSRPSQNLSETFVRRRLVVAFHDLHAGNYHLCQTFLERIAEVGIDRACLLTVPSWHGSGRACDAPEFCNWLRSARGAGHEVVLHGFRHIDESSTPINPAALFMARVYTAGEGEFHRIDCRLAREKLATGRYIINQCSGERPDGFVAPAWLLAHRCIPLLEQMGFLYTTTLEHIILLQQQRQISAPAISISTRSALRRRISKTWMRWMEKLTAQTEILRIAVHPGDLEHPLLAGRLYELLARAQSNRRIATYREIATEADQ